MTGMIRPIPIESITTVIRMKAIANLFGTFVAAPGHWPRGRVPPQRLDSFARPSGRPGSGTRIRDRS